MGTTDARGKKPEDTALQDELNDFYDEEFKSLITHEKFNLTRMGHLLEYLAIHVQTAIHNNLKVHFEVV